MTILLLLLAMITPPAAPSIMVKATPSVCIEPCYVRVDVVIPPHEDNRWASVQLDGPEMFRSSWIQLFGDTSAKRWTFNYPNLPYGEYSIVAILYNNQKETSRARTTVVVAGDNSLRFPKMGKQ